MTASAMFLPVALLIALALCADSTEAFELPPLPYAFNALEPAIDEHTMRLHHGKHFAGYTRNMNAALKALNKTGTTEEGLKELLGDLDGIKNATLRTAIRNNGGGYLNHLLYFASFQAPSADNEPTGALAVAMSKTWCGFSHFQTAFKKCSTSLFGSGWCVLVVDEGELSLKQYDNQDNSAMDEGTVVPLLGFDVWEHAYYKKYSNRRGDHIDALWLIIKWDVVGKRYEDAL